MKHLFHFPSITSSSTLQFNLNRNERTFQRPFPFSFDLDKSEIEDSDLIGFFIYLVPFKGPIVEIEDNIYYTHGLRYKKLLFSHIADGDRGIQAFISNNKEVEIAIEKSESANYNLINKKNLSIAFSTNGVKYPTKYGINYLDFDFQPELVKGLNDKIRVGNYSLSYIAVDDLRYMLSDVIANPDKTATLSISGAKIQPWKNIRVDENSARNIDEDIPGRGYFTLKLELAVNEVVLSASNVRRDIIERIRLIRDLGFLRELDINIDLDSQRLDTNNLESILKVVGLPGASLPRLLMSIPCPPIWHPSKLVNYGNLKTEELVALYRNFGDKAIPQLMAQQARIPDFGAGNSPPEVIPVII